MRALIAVLLLVATASQAVTPIEAETRYGYTSEPRTFGIDVADYCPGCVRYEWELVWYEHNQVVSRGAVLPTGPTVTHCGKTWLAIRVSLPRTGHYFLRVRACTASACTDYGSSMDATRWVRSDCTPGASWHYGTVQPPGTPVFTQE